ncbi:hypothetical protein Q9R19_06120 [Microbacterium sp. ARD32]|uniref:hypothetical protein n=1 Tax=Microbacterium sp. ARD32 TaxID=2962577 RepID=UPI0028814C7F|nr:hypothetical protein [Microbacterium sp. ARD32]MDT0157199.1 hypothetical protein [Microbacterium sp. ARD32]
MHRWACMAGLLVVVSSLSACGTAPTDEGGFGLGTLSSEDAVRAADAAGVVEGPLQGWLAVSSSGCFHWSGDIGDGAWIVWPDSARLDDADGARVVLENGEVIAAGSTLSGFGAIIALEDLPQGDERDSYFGSFGGFCGAGETGVVLLSEVTASG